MKGKIFVSNYELRTITHDNAHLHRRRATFEKFPMKDPYYEKDLLFPSIPNTKSWKTIAFPET